MTITLVIVLAPVALAAYAYAARRTRGRSVSSGERRRLEQIDERRAVAHLYPSEHRLETAPQHPPHP